jgi:hypothetical protein
MLLVKCTLRCLVMLVHNIMFVDNLSIGSSCLVNSFLFSMKLTVN